MTISFFVQLSVKDFDAWKQYFDAAASFMKDMGVISSTVHRKADDPNSIMILQQIAESAAPAYLAAVEGSKARRAEEGILTWAQWVGKSV
jgi:hypothetical protein